MGVFEAIRKGLSADVFQVLVKGEASVADQHDRATPHSPGDHDAALVTSPYQYVCTGCFRIHGPCCVEGDAAMIIPDAVVTRVKVK